MVLLKQVSLYIDVNEPDDIRQIADKRPISVESAFNGCSEIANANIWVYKNLLNSKYNYISLTKKYVAQV